MIWAERVNIKVRILGTRRHPWNQVGNSSVTHNQVAQWVKLLLCR